VSAPAGFDELLRQHVAEEVERRCAELERPELVTQRNVAAVVGMPERDYLRHVRAGDWPAWKDRRLRYSRTADVVAWVQAHPARNAAPDSDAEERAFARAGLRRIGGSR
jgi:hypothetical protein